MKKNIFVLLICFIVLAIAGCGGGGGGVVNTASTQNLLTYTTEVGYSSIGSASSIQFTLNNNSKVNRTVTLISSTVDSKVTTVRIIDKTSGKEHSFVLESSLGAYHQQFEEVDVLTGAEWVHLTDQNPQVGVTQTVPPNSTIKISINVSKG